MDALMLLNYSIAFFSLFTVFFFVLLFLRYRRQVAEAPPQAGNWQPVVSVIIPAHNEEAGIGATIESALGLDYPRDKLDIIVVDDGSADGTLGIAKGYERQGVLVLTQPNAGKGAALNNGIRRARGELIATMDADSMLSPPALGQMLPFFADKEVMAVTPAVKVKPDSGKLLVELQRIEYLMILFSRKLLSFIDSVPVTPGPFSLFRAEAFQKVGPFDEHNLVEDQEICLRLQAAHYKVRSSMTATVYTRVPGSMKSLLRQRVRWQRGGLRNYWKYKFLIRPEYGDFGMFFVPLNYVSIAAFFLILGLMVNSVFASPYYTKYILVDSYVLGLGLITIIGALVLASTVLWLWLSVRAFKERIPLQNLVLFVLFYWYLMLGYNVLTAVKEIRREPATW
jgi:biofilm PGA synthesis N-glycosyltransferase PgaC